MSYYSKDYKGVQEVVGKIRCFFTPPGTEDNNQSAEKLKIILSFRGLQLLVRYSFTLFICVLSFIGSLILRLFNRKEDYYLSWLKNQEKLSRKRYKLSIYPKFTFIIHEEEDPHSFQSTISSILNQSYSNWELVVIGSGENKKLPEKCRTINTGDRSYSEALNYVLGKITGTYYLVLGQGDVLSPYLLLEAAKEVNNSDFADVIYTDEDKIINGKFGKPDFKPDWCPDNLLSRNYLGKSVLIKLESATKVGGYITKYEKAHHYELLLRITEKSEKIAHIPKVLYHTDTSRTLSIIDTKAEQLAIADTLKRRGEDGNVKEIRQGIYLVRYNIRHKGKVSIIIPSKNKAELLSTCVRSIFAKTTYKDFEVLVIDNGSTEQEFFEVVQEWKEKEPERFRVINYDIPFNYSTLNNYGVKHASGDFYLFLNNDTEVITSDWLEGMIEQAQRPSIGAVGSKLLFPDDTIQHAGIVLGLHGITGHTFATKPRKARGYNNYLITVNNYSALTAACLMVRKDIFEKVGGFDEKFAVDYNDIDLCLRLHSSGYNNIYLPHVQLYHNEGLSRGHVYANKKSYKRFTKETELFKSKWKDYLKQDPCFNPVLVKESDNLKIAI